MFVYYADKLTPTPIELNILIVKNNRKQVLFVGGKKHKEIIYN